MLKVCYWSGRQEPSWLSTVTPCRLRRGSVLSSSWAALWTSARTCRPAGTSAPGWKSSEWPTSMQRRGMSSMHSFFTYSTSRKYSKSSLEVPNVWQVSFSATDSEKMCLTFIKYWSSMSKGQTKCYISWAVLCSIHFMRFAIFATLYQKQNLGCV